MTPILSGCHDNFHASPHLSVSEHLPSGVACKNRILPTPHDPLVLGPPTKGGERTRTNYGWSSGPRKDQLRTRTKRSSMTSTTITKTAAREMIRDIRTRGGSGVEVAADRDELVLAEATPLDVVADLHRAPFDLDPLDRDLLAAVDVDDHAGLDVLGLDLAVDLVHVPLLRSFSLCLKCGMAPCMTQCLA